MPCGPPPGMYAIFARHVRHPPQTCAPSLPDTEPIPTAHKKSDGPPPGDPSLDVLEAGLEPAQPSLAKGF